MGLGRGEGDGGSAGEWVWAGLGTRDQGGRAEEWVEGGVRSSFSFTPHLYTLPCPHALPNCLPPSVALTFRLTPPTLHCPRLLSQETVSFPPPSVLLPPAAASCPASTMCFPCAAPTTSHPHPHSLPPPPFRCLCFCEQHCAWRMASADPQLHPTPSQPYLVPTLCLPPYPPSIALT